LRLQPLAAFKSYFEVTGCPQRGPDASLIKEMFAFSPAPQRGKRNNAAPIARAVLRAT
jgi:hypothetical protein